MSCRGPEGTENDDMGMGSPDAKSREKAPGEQLSGGRAPADQVSADQAPGNQAPDSQTPGGRALAARPQPRAGYSLRRAFRALPILWCTARLRLFDRVGLFAEETAETRSASSTKLPGAVSALDPAGGRDRARAEERRAAWLRTQLRRWPFWGAGHRELAKSCLTLEQVECAYPSALAWRALSDRLSTDRVQAHHFLGKCFLKRGDPQAALRELDAARELLESGLDVTPRLQYGILEDRGAALMALARHEEALACLHKIPVQFRSAELMAASEFLTNRPHAP